MKYVSKTLFFFQLKKPGGPSKELPVPLEGRGPPVGKHWSRNTNFQRNNKNAA